MWHDSCIYSLCRIYDDLRNRVIGKNFLVQREKRGMEKPLKGGKMKALDLIRK